MSEQVEAKPRRGGWPKGKPRVRTPTVEAVKAAADRAEVPKQWKFKARPNWESEDFVGVGMEGVDRLNISMEKLEDSGRQVMSCNGVPSLSAVWKLRKSFRR